MSQSGKRWTSATRGYGQCPDKLYSGETILITSGPEISVFKDSITVRATFFSHGSYTDHASTVVRNPEPCYERNMSPRQPKRQFPRNLNLVSLALEFHHNPSTKWLSKLTLQNQGCSESPRLSQSRRFDTRPHSRA